MDLLVNLDVDNLDKAACFYSSTFGMNAPQQAAGYQNSAMRFVLRASPPNVFIGGRVRISVWLSPVEPPLKGCGE